MLRAAQVFAMMVVGPIAGSPLVAQHALRLSPTAPLVTLCG
jgi:hypothetical protein